MLRKFHKPLSTSALPSCRPDVISVLSRQKRKSENKEGISEELCKNNCASDDYQIQTCVSVSVSTRTRVSASPLIIEFRRADIPVVSHNAMEAGDPLRANRGE